MFKMCWSEMTQQSNVGVSMFASSGKKAKVEAAQKDVLIMYSFFIFKDEVPKKNCKCFRPAIVAHRCKECECLLSVALFQCRENPRQLLELLN